MKSLVLLISLLLIVTWGCKDNILDNSNLQQQKAYGSLALKFDPSNIPTNVNTVIATLTRQGYSNKTFSMDIRSDSSASAYFSDIIVGLWHLKVDAFDRGNNLVYTGETNINVEENIEVQVNLELNPVFHGTGSISIYVTWANPTKYWSLQKSGISENLQCVFFIDTCNGWAAGGIGAGTGKILKTTDGGKNWILQNTPVINRINWLHFLNADNGFAVGDFGTFIKTTNGGMNWENVDISVTNSLFQICFNNGTGWVVGKNGTIIKSIDNGLTWQIQPRITWNDNYGVNYAYDHYAVNFVSNTSGFIVGQYGMIFKTSNGGETWIKSASNTGFGWLQSIKQFDSNTLISVAGLGIIIKSYDNGANWNFINSGTSEHLEDICLLNSRKAYVVGDHGTILYTQDLGETWKKEPQVTYNWLNAVFFVNNYVGWAVGNNGTIVKCVKY